MFQNSKWSFRENPKRGFNLSGAVIFAMNGWTLVRFYSVIRSSEANVSDFSKIKRRFFSFKKIKNSEFIFFTSFILNGRTGECSYDLTIFFSGASFPFSVWDTHYGCCSQVYKRGILNFCRELSLCLKFLFFFEAIFCFKAFDSSITEKRTTETKAGFYFS